MTKKQEYMKKWREKNRDHEIAYRRKYDDLNRESRRSACRRWYANRDDETKLKRRLSRKEWADQHPDRIAEFNSRTYQNHKEFIKLRVKIYAAKNRQSIRIKRAIYSSDNKEKINARQKIWYRNNPHIAKAGADRRRAVLAGAKIGNGRVMAEWFARWKSLESVKCYWCQSEFNPRQCVGDHITALANGGCHSIENLCISCSTCNSKKYSKSLVDWNLEIENPVLL